MENGLALSEKALLKDENLFDLILENVSSGVALIDETGTFLLYNKTFLKLFGLSEESTIKNVNDQNWSEWQVINENRDILHVDDHPVRKAALTGKRVNNQVVGVKLPSGGDLIWMLVSAEPIYNEHRQHVKTICTYQDITQNKHAEENLVINEDRLRLTLESAELGTWDFDIETGIAVHSLRHDQIFGYQEPQPEWYYEMSIRHMLPEYHQVARDAVANAIKTGLLYYEAQIVWSDGSIHWIEFKGRVLYDNDGKPIRMIGVVSDITERKRAEEAIRTARERTQQVLESITDHYIYLDKEWRFVDVNKAAELSLGRSRSELIGKVYWDLYPNAIGSEYHKKLLVAWNDQVPVHFEEFSQSFQLWLESHVYPHDGGLEFFVNDITERKKAEFNLLQSIEEFKALSENSPDNIDRMDRDSHHLFVNNTAAKMMGLTSDAIVGKTNRELGVGEPYASEWEERIRMVFDTGKTMETESEFPSVEGNKYWHIRCVPEFSHGKVVSVLAVSRDITERKRSEQALRESEQSLAEAQHLAHIGSWEWNIQTGNIHWSKELFSIFGLDCNSFVPSIQAMAEFVHPEDREFRNNKTAPIFSEYKSFNFDYRIVRPDGSIRYLNTVGEIKDLDDDGKPRLMKGFIQDITERKLAEKALKENEERLRDLNATKDKFFSIIAHDLRSPFTSIIGFIDLLIDKIQKKENDGIEKYSRIIAKSSRMAMDLLTNLFEWSRLQTGKMDFKPAQIDLAAIIHEVIDHISVAARQKSIEISKEFPASVSAFADKQMISTVLRNLLSNAIKFTNAGGVINISVIPKKNELLISVKDNGVGISQPDVEKLFRIDVGHSTSGTDEEQGTGLGLMLCKEFVLKHKGKILVRSEVGIGSEFVFTLPVTDP